MQKRINTTIEIQFMDKRGKYSGVNRAYKGKRLLQSLNSAITSLTEMKGDSS
jgi:hypothetical protein